MLVDKFQNNPSLLQDVEALFRELSAGLSEGCAKVQVSDRTDSTVVDLVPSNPTAARLRAIVPKMKNVGVTLVAGRGSFFEIPAGGHRYTDLPLLQELRSLCLAVIRGGLEEVVTFDGEEVLQGTGTIRSAEPLTVRWRQLTIRPFRKKTKKRFSYEPYHDANA